MAGIRYSSLARQTKRYLPHHTIRDLKAKIDGFRYICQSEALAEWNEILDYLNYLNYLDYLNGDEEQKIKVRAYNSVVWGKYRLVCRAKDEYLIPAKFVLYNLRRSKVGLPEVPERAFKVFTSGLYNFNDLNAVLANGNFLVSRIAAG